MPNEFRAVGKAPKISFDRTAVVYEQATGEILHTHRLTVATKTKARLSDGDLERRAIEAAGKFVERSKLSSAAVLEIEPDALARLMDKAPGEDAFLRVDAASKRLAWAGKQTTAE